MHFIVSLHQKALCRTLQSRVTRGLSEFAMSSSSQPSSDAPAEASTTPIQKPTPLVMQIVVRKDLLTEDGWGVGPLMAQVAHATSAVLHGTRERTETKEYLDDLVNMHKTIFQVDNSDKLDKLTNTLKSADPQIPHHLWIEQPENIPTCLALAPNRRDPRVKKALDKCGCKLWRS